MDFSLSTEQEILRESVRSFAEKEIKPVAGELDEKETFSYDTMRKMAELGLFGIFVSEEFGGQGMDYVSYIIAVEEIARVDGSHAATVAAENSLGIGPLYYFGNEHQKRKYLPQLCTGQVLWGFGLTEPNAGSDAANTHTTAVLDGDEWVINGALPHRFPRGRAAGAFLHSGGSRHPRLYRQGNARKDDVACFQHERTLF
jgi:short/branched chain acyl-CoA dehydrogenase